MAVRISGRTGFVAFFAADMLSTLGTFVSMVALPWLVLLTTGSPAKMGTIALAEMGTFLLASVFAPPLADRLGLKLTSVASDALSALSMGAIALTPHIGFLPLVVLVAVTGGLRGVGDRAKTVLLGPMVKLAGFGMKRVMGAYSSLVRLCQLVGASIGGLLVFWFGAQGAVAVDAASFVVCGIVIGALVWPPPLEPPAEKPSSDEVKGGYLAAFREGMREASRDQVVLGLTVVIFGLNILNQANNSVFVPLWISSVLHSAAAGGTVMSAYAIGSVLGSVVFTALANRLPRRATVIVGALLGSVPRPLVLGFSHNLVLVLVVTFVSGVAGAATNPTYGALLYERVPARFQNRVFGLLTAVCAAGLPLGGVLAGVFVAGLGLRGGIVTTAILGGALIFAALVWYRRATVRSEEAVPTPEPAPA
ncbi:MAG TPA: MFS transporter [Pseudonocardiaceae bacterium]|nr:MFS transporter [Pseudonocardiaceae bacterium]